MCSKPAGLELSLGHLSVADQDGVERAGLAVYCPNLLLSKMLPIATGIIQDVYSAGMRALQKKPNISMSLRRPVQLEARTTIH